MRAFDGALDPAPAAQIWQPGEQCRRNPWMGSNARVILTPQRAGLSNYRHDNQETLNGGLILRRQ